MTGPVGKLAAGDAGAGAVGKLTMAAGKLPGAVGKMARAAGELAVLTAMAGAVGKLTRTVASTWYWRPGRR